MEFVLLIKPQFEIDPDLVPEGGVVADDRLREHAVSQVLEFLAELDIHQVQVKDCRVAGRTGNRELFIHFKTRLNQSS